MKFVCDGLSLSEAVLKVSKACAARTTAPIMECIKLSAFGEEVSLLATDGELSIRKTIRAEIFPYFSSNFAGSLMIGRVPSSWMIPSSTASCSSAVRPVSPASVPDAEVVSSPVLPA